MSLFVLTSTIWLAVNPIVPAAAQADAGAPNRVDAGHEPIWRSLPATKVPRAGDAVHLPTYAHGKVIELKVRDRFAYLVKPNHLADGRKRWVWIFPFEHGLEDSRGQVQHRFYVERLLGLGFHVAGISVGVSCGSPAAAEVCQEFYRQLVNRHGLNKRARLLAQSNGGLIAYAWAFRNVDCVDRIAGIYPATDLRRWPGVANLLAYPEKGLGYNMTIEQVETRLRELNPIDNLAPLAKGGVKLLHIHGDTDPLVTIDDHTLELFRRYEKLGGSHELIVVKGLGHGGKPFTESKRLVEFLVAD